MRHEAERERHISQHDIIRAGMYLVLVVGFVSLMVLFPTLYVRVYMYGHHIQQSMYQPGKVANPARGQLNRGIFVVS